MSASDVSQSGNRWRNCIAGHDEIVPGTLKAHPDNWRFHSERQKGAMIGVLEDVGWVRAVLVNRTTGRIIDGHMRWSLAIERRESTIPVDYVELSEREEAIILASHDTIGTMAKVLTEKLDAVLRKANTGHEKVQSLLSECHRKAKLHLKAANSPGVGSEPVEGDRDASEGGGSEKKDAPTPSLTAKFPLAIVLDVAVKRRWDRFKESAKVKKDAEALVSLMDKAGVE